MQWEKQKNGFTIVELLVVVVVIAILASITIVAYNGIQTQAKNSQMISGVGTYVKAIRSYHSMNGLAPMTTDGVQCFNGKSCWSNTDITASQALRTNVSQVISALPDFPDGHAALVTYSTTTDSVNGGNYTGWYVLFQVVDVSRCPEVGELRYLNTSMSGALRICRSALIL